MELDLIIENLIQSLSESFYNLIGYRPEGYITFEEIENKPLSYKYYVYLPCQTELALINTLNRFIEIGDNQYRIYHTQFIPLRLKIEIDQIKSDQYLTSFYILDRLKIVYDILEPIGATVKTVKHELILSFIPIVLYHKDYPDSSRYVFDTTKEVFKPDFISKKDPNSIPLKFLKTLDQVPYINKLLHTIIETSGVEVILAINNYDTDYKTLAFMFQLNDPNVLEKFYNLWVNWQILLDMRKR